MPIQSLEDLNFPDDDPEKKIVPSEPEGTELSTFVQWTNDVTGEVVSTDKKIPRLNIGQKSGSLGESKGFGNLILNKEDLIVPFGQQIHTIVLKIRKQYQERRPYDPSSTTMPRMFNTAKEAVAAGFSTEWGDEKCALPIAQILFFIPAPAGLDKEVIEQNFFYEFEGIHYTAALFFTSPTGYNVTAKPIFSSLDTPKVKEFGSPRIIRWTSKVDKQINAKNSWFNLKMIATGLNSPELVAYTKSILP
jgi:hypothetical protein